MLPVMARIRTNTHVDVGIAERVRALRVEMELSQRDLQLPGVSYAYISRIESGTRVPSISAVVMLAARLRDAAEAKLDNYLPIQPDDDAAFVAHVERLQWIVEHCSALYLLTGDPYQPCLVCGRHDHEGATTNGYSNGSTRR